MAAEVKAEPASFSPAASEAEKIPVKQEPTTSEPAAAAQPDSAEPAVASSSAAAGSAPGPGSEGRKVSTADIQLVQNLIERCLQMYLSQREVVSTLHQQAKIEPGFTQLVWQKLEEQNPDFFRAYFTRLKLKDQINLFNHLLEQQVNVVQRMQRGWMQPPGMMMQPRPGMPLQSMAMQSGMPMHSQYPAAQQVKHEQDGLGGIAPLESTADFDTNAQPSVEDNLNLGSTCCHHQMQKMAVRQICQLTLLDPLVGFPALAGFKEDFQSVTNSGVFQETSACQICLWINLVQKQITMLWLCGIQRAIMSCLQCPRT